MEKPWKKHGENSMDSLENHGAGAKFHGFHGVITHWEKLLDSDWLRLCEFIRNLRANSVIRGKLQISRAKSVIHSECKYKQELRINN